MQDCQQRNCFPLSEKLNFLSEFDSNVGPQNASSEHLRISTSTLATIIRQREELRKASAEYVETSSKIIVIESHQNLRFLMLYIKGVKLVARELYAAHNENF
ncbi:hypothetical protein TNCV_2995361 [Trichonephila clavipes]|nr:hypothetical protein TNCV_2995361 [Trichonephila clavipes]